MEGQLRPLLYHAVCSAAKDFHPKVGSGAGSCGVKLASWLRWAEAGMPGWRATATQGP